MNRKMYYSFHDIPFGSSGYGYERPALRFSRREIMELFISIVILSLAFSIARSRMMYGGYERMGYLMVSSFLAVITAFACHEVAHKYVGMRYGYWSEYRMFPQGLLLALLLSFTGFLFAAPGAVVIFGSPPREENGKISAAGPATNIAISAVCAPLSPVIGGMAGEIVGGIAAINAFLAFFNLIPFGPLDGRKILAWNTGVWAMMLVVSIALIMFSMGLL